MVGFMVHSGLAVALEKDCNTVHYRKKQLSKKGYGDVSTL
jgi:hypothetical protein